MMPDPDLLFDPELLDDHLVVRCRISRGPRRGDATFTPHVGVRVLVDDGEGHPLPALVLRRRGDAVLVRILEPHRTLVAALRDVLRSPA
jgi:hypothetical protein